MKFKITFVALVLNVICLGLFAQAPFVYKLENTGASCAPPPLPSFSQLPVVVPLPDPFMRSDGSGRSTKLADWECRRNEIKAEIENYEIGIKPNRPDSITASYAAGVLTVNVTRNGQTLTLTSQVSLPAGAGPFPAVIGMNSLSGSLPADIFTSRNIVRITFSHNQVTTYGGQRLTDPYYRLYPQFNTENIGQYSAWAWGVSRIIDGLELVQSSLPVDLSHVAVTGCSYAGKMALFAGAFDERVALTIAQESGGGGAPAWRVSETLGVVEKLGVTDYNWFKEDMRQFTGTNVAKLPHDHHELMAMVAPRALLVTGNTDFEWLANPSTYASARAAHQVWKTFGIGDRFGFYVDGRHNHCAIPATQRPAIEAFVDKFLMDKATVNTDTITINPYPEMDYQRWYQWWGTGNAAFPLNCPANVVVAAPSCTTPVAISWAEPRDTFPASVNLSGSTVMAYKGTFNGHGYYEATGLYTWENARDAAKNAGGHLLTINSAAENAFVLSSINQGNNSAWIGLYNTGARGSFAWVTGEPVSYTNWIPGQPDNLYRNATDPTIYEPYVHINGWADPALCQWNDIGATTTAHFIAEFDAPAYTYRQISGPANGSTQLPGVYNVCYERTTSASNVKDTCCYSITVRCNSSLVDKAGSPGTVTDISKRLQVTAFPNPTSDFFKVQISGSNSVEKVSMQVSDITGKVIENKMGISTNQVLNFGSNLKAGVYFVQVTQGSSKAMVKVVKQ